MVRKKDFLNRIRHHPKNIFSTTSGLKGYGVGRKRFPPTKEGFRKAARYSTRKYGRGVISYKY